jgi:hypothetical protein
LLVQRPSSATSLHASPFPSPVPIRHQSSRSGQGLGRFQAAGSAGGRQSGPGIVGSCGWSCPAPVGAGQRRGWPGRCLAWSRRARAGIGCAGDCQRGCAGPGPSGRLIPGLARHRQHGEGGVAGTAARTGPGTPYDGRHDGPTPGRLSRSGRQPRTTVGDRPGVLGDLKCSEAGCGGPGRAGWSRWRQARPPRWPAGGAVHRRAPDLGVIQPQAVLTRCRGRRPPARGARALASVAAWTAERLAASRTDNAAGWPAAPGRGELVAGEGFTGCLVASRGQPWRRGRGAARLGRQFRDLLGMRMQQPGSAGAVPTGALDRPDPCTPGGGLPTAAAAGSRLGWPLPSRSPGSGSGRHDDRPRRGCGSGVDPDGRARRGLPAYASR